MTRNSIMFIKHNKIEEIMSRIPFFKLSFTEIAFHEMIIRGTKTRLKNVYGK